MKKLASICIAAAMIFGQFVLPVSAGSGWSSTYYGTAATDTAVFGTEKTTEHKYDGGNAMFVKAAVSSVNEENYLELKNTLKEPVVKGGKYKLVLMSKLESSKNTKIVLGDMSFAFKKDADIKPTETAIAAAPSGETGWTQFEYSFTYTGENPADSLSFRFYSSIFTGQVIDNVALYKDGSTDSLVEDGGFEGSGDIDREEGGYNTAVLQPRNMMCSATANGLTLNWINPTSSELRKVAVYDITGAEVLLTDAVSAVPGETVLYPITGLTNDSVYQYKIIFSYKTKPDYVYYLTGTPINLSSVMTKDAAGDWTLIRRRNTDGAKYTPGYACIDAAGGRDGSSAMKFVANITSELQAKGNTFVGGYIETGMKSGKRYEVKLYAKAQNLNGTPKATMNFKKFEKNQTNISAGTDWTENTFYYSEGETVFYITFDGMCDALWIDDLQIYEVDADGNRVTGENILPGGSFEGIAAVNDGSVAKLAAAPSNYGAKLSWTNTATDCKAFDIYMKVFDEWQWRGTLSNAYSEFELKNLSTGTDYEIAIAPVDSSYCAGIMSSIAFTTLLAESTVTESALYQGTEQVNGIGGEDDYTVVTKVNNYGIKNGFTATQCVAVYDSDEVLVLFKTTSENVEQGKAGTEPTKLSTSFKLPKNGRKIEVYILDTTSDMNILRSCECFE